MRSFVLLAALAAAALPSVVRAADVSCLTAREFAAVSAYAMPSVISGAAQGCVSALPADAYLRRDGGQLAGRYAANRSAAWPAAKVALLKVVAGGDASRASMVRALPDESLRPLVDTLISQQIEQQVPAARCTTISRALQLIAPLPADNAAELVSLILGLAANTSARKLGPLTLCPA